MSVTTFSPTLTLPLTNHSKTTIQGYKLWASIPANDETGIVIDNVMAGDTIIIYDASGICSFASTNMKMVKAIVGIANQVAEDVFKYATDGEGEVFVRQWNKALKSISDAVGDTDIKHKRRDAYGQDPGSGDYGKQEGGLIVCMPTSRGAIYATSDYYLASGSKKDGRKTQYYSQDAKNTNTMYPCPVSGGLMQQTAEKAGAIQILAFDENFQDNGGAYNVGLLVIRAGNDIDTISQELLAAGPSA